MPILTTTTQSCLIECIADIFDLAIFPFGKEAPNNEPPTKIEPYPEKSCVTIKAFYNNQWMQQFNNDHMEAVTAIEEIIDEANKIYQIPGLGTEITLKLVECMHKSIGNYF